MHPKVSIIVPFYNAESYLEACLDSLQRQTLADCEFLFVNDGSTDGSRRIVERRMAADRRIRLFDQENSGVSSARNAGLAAVSGDYVGFVDADDSVAADMFEVLHGCAVAADCDVVLSHFEEELEGCRRVVRYPFPTGRLLDRTYIEGDLLPYFVRSDGLNSVCNKLYRHRLVADLRFPEHLKLGEDGRFNVQAFAHASRIWYADYAGYHYREVSGSATRSMLRHDYFERAVEVYRDEPPELFHARSDISKLREWKAEKLMEGLLGLIYVSFKPGSELPFRERYRKVQRMVGHPCVREALTLYRRQPGRGRYKRTMTRLIGARAVWGLYGLTVYNRLRTYTYGRMRK